MAQNLIVQLTDDIEGGDATETVEFSIDGRTYQIDLNKKNASAMRKVFQLYVEKGRVVRQPVGRGRRAGSASNPTLFSQLNSDEKERFRGWSRLPDARRIADSRVQEWIDAGRP
jgi:hypothetical protein